ncbi:hypothetical protein JXD38_11340, partial [candidate division WOR-3 bacterium]|nr:hypothetical protein [candidate division WOR-3 bacterium]
PSSLVFGPQSSVFGLCPRAAAIVRFGRRVEREPKAYGLRLTVRRGYLLSVHSDAGQKGRKELRK